MTIVNPSGRVTLRVREVAALTGLPMSTVRDLIKRGGMPHVVLGNGRRKLIVVEVDQLLAYLRAHRVEAVVSGTRAGR